MNEFTSISNSIPKEFLFRTIDKKLNIEDFGINVDDPKKARKTISDKIGGRLGYIAHRVKNFVGEEKLSDVQITFRSEIDQINGKLDQLRRVAGDINMKLTWNHVNLAKKQHEMLQEVNAILPKIPVNVSASQVKRFEMMRSLLQQISICLAGRSDEQMNAIPELLQALKDMNISYTTPYGQAIMNFVENNLMENRSRSDFKKEYSLVELLKEKSQLNADLIKSKQNWEETKERLGNIKKSVRGTSLDLPEVKEMAKKTKEVQKWLYRVDDTPV
jgi:hypothetical protein